MSPTPKDVALARQTLAADRKAKREIKRASFGPRPFPNAKADRGRVRDGGFLAYLRRLPCVACLVEGGNCGPTEAAHLRFSDAAQGRVNPGLQCKPSDQYATPLGSGHHRGDQHQRSERAFWERLGIEPGALAAALYAAYLAGADGMPVLRSFTDRRAA